jgi:hypothetical protein
MDLHFEGNKLYYMEKEAELYAALQIVSKELNGQESMTKEEVWDVFNILMDTSAVYRHITDYFNVLDKKILEARVENGKLKQEMYDLRKQNASLEKTIEGFMNDF